MKDLDMLFDHVMDELLGADNYADWALKASNADHKRLLVEMAKQELNHAHNLENIVADKIKEITIDPDSYRAVHSYLQNKWDEYERKINYKINLIK